jgi:transcriptional regulator with XRE-family HTH domain
MSKRTEPGDVVRSSLSELGSLAERATSADPAVLEEVGPALDAFRRAVVAAVPRQHDDFASSYEGVSTFPQIVGANVKRVREEADLTQAKVAEAMNRLGFDWKRITVTQVESATRRLALEELCCLAALFAVPMLELLLPADDDNAEIPAEGATQLDAQTLRELLIGRGGRVGSGGPNWQPALELVGIPTSEDDVRPAVALWERRRPGRRR